MITILAFYERISIFHTMTPFFLPKYRKLFLITNNINWCLKNDKNKILFIERFFKNDSTPDINLFKLLRDKYEKIVFFDGYAAAGTHNIELLEYADFFYHKSVFIDRSNYTKTLYAGRLFADYYHKKYNIIDSIPPYTPVSNLTLEQSYKIQLSWNIGLGTYPRYHLPQRIGTLIARFGLPSIGRFFSNGQIKKPHDFSSPKRKIPVNARIGMIKSESVNFQRRLIKEKITNDTRFVTDFVPQIKYYAELENSKIVLSPFGWGEVCFRDFEAIVSGSLLLKPSMEHLMTWPDIYKPYETYVPIDWDISDLKEKTDYYLANDSERERIAKNAWEQLFYQRTKIEDYFGNILNQILV
ncbi:MAG: glycosyltransferase family 1 protein [Bacteroidales bacterium]|nr:glycosyltransferase family 1 protein [Bacteroidales bacterium]